MSIGAILIFKVFNDNIVFYFTPSELLQKNKSNIKTPFRIGGLVKENSLKQNDDNIEFVITDLNSEIKVQYKGLLPALFKEEQGTVALGVLNESGIFIASNILAKHDENYMPKEVADSLKRNYNIN